MLIYDICKVDDNKLGEVLIFQENMTQKSSTILAVKLVSLYFFLLYDAKKLYETANNYERKQNVDQVWCIIIRLCQNSFLRFQVA